MTYADTYNIRTTSVKFNDVANALDGLITRNYVGLTTGTSTAYIATPTPAWDAYTTAGLVVIIPHVSNSGACSINISGLGTKSILIGGATIGAGVLQQNIPTILAYTGTHFEVLLQSIAIPSGTIYSYAGATSPAGYLLCDGAAVSRTTYSTLFGIVGTTYGSGDGVNTFNLPDLSRRTPVGKGASDTLGASDGVVYASRSLSHSHSVPPHYHGMGTGADLAVDISHTHASSSVTIPTTSSGHSHGHNLQAASGGAHTHTYTITYQTNTVNSDSASNTRLKGTDSTGTTRTNTTAIAFDSSGFHGHSVTGTIGGTDGTHTHSGSTAAGQTLGVTNKTPSGSIGLVTGGVDGNAAMTSGASTQPYLVLNYIIKT